MVRPVGATESATEEGTEAGDVVHVQVREKQVVDGLDLGKQQRPKAAITTVEKQAAHGLAAIDGHQQGIVAAFVAEYLERQAHEIVS